MLKKLLLFIFISFLSFLAINVYADTASDLQDKINAHNDKIKQLEEEIRGYNQEVTKVGAQATTLQNTIKTLNLTEKKITTDLTLTEQKIGKTTLTITQLGDEIKTTQDRISNNRKAITNIIRNTNILESANMVALVLSSKNVSDAWDEMETMHEVQSEIKTKTDLLHELTGELQDKQVKLGAQKNQLVGLKQDLNGKKLAVEYSKTEKSTLLTETKNKEQTYRNLIATREQEKAQFEKELYDFEAQLHYIIDPSTYPSPKQSILSWPLDDVYITQKFGKTVGAEKLYVSGSHNGVDFRASTGTRVKNVLDGIVVGTGNTDLYPGCYSFGKWVMVRHGNGLSTIYGHLSVISVNKGDQLKTGDVIGYSGNTGYSTGPHLHISVYATQGVRIEQYTQSKGCKQAIIPLADVRAYLDPLLYFPSL